LIACNEPELLIQVPSGGGAHTVAADALGSPRLVTDASGTVVGTTQFDAFGAVKQQSGTAASVGFTGEQQDSESGLVYLRARYYDPRTGRFLSKDPLSGCGGSPASQHAYAYAYNNPLRFTDRTGRAVDDSGDIGFDNEPLPAGHGPDEPLPTPDKDVPSIDSVKNVDDPLCEFGCVPIIVGPRYIAQRRGARQAERRGSSQLPGLFSGSVPLWCGDGWGFMVLLETDGPGSWVIRAEGWLVPSFRQTRLVYLAECLSPAGCVGVWEVGPSRRHQWEEISLPPGIRGVLLSCIPGY
jgi:RHS repeat-associated protein